MRIKNTPIVVISFNKVFTLEEPPCIQVKQPPRAI